MIVGDAKDNRVRRVLYVAIGLIFALFVGQWAIYQYRFVAIDAVAESFEILEERCDNKKCSATFSNIPKHRYLLLGHILRTHRLIHADSNEELLPTSKVRGVAKESWRHLRVYSVNPGENYLLLAEKPKATRLPYFIGVSPRSSDHKGMLSVPDVTPTVNMISSIVGFIVLWILLGAAWLVPSTSRKSSKQIVDLYGLLICTIAVTVVSALSTGIADSLLPDGDTRSYLLRTSAVLSVMGLYSYGLFRKFLNSELLASAVTVAIPFVFMWSFWSIVRAGIGYIAVYTLCVIGLSAFFAWRSRFLIAGFVLVALLDSAFISGYRLLADFPPQYFLQPVLVTAFSLYFCDLGASSVIGLAAKSYHRFNRDLSLGKISAQLGRASSTDQLTDSVKEVLPNIASLMNAERVSVLINLPFSRPVTQRYLDSEVITYDDGRIPGEVTIRAFVYGDEAWFEPYHEFAARLNISNPNNSDGQGQEYVCIAPIRVNTTPMGVLMITGFDDSAIERLIKSGEISDERETAKQLVDTISSSFSEQVIANFRGSREISDELMQRVRSAIALSESDLEFLHRFAESISHATGMITLVHEKIEDKGPLVTQVGLDLVGERLFSELPFNLSSDSSAVGPTVVAFRENKTSYLKSWKEIRDQLHPRTCEVLALIKANSVMAIPMKTSRGQHYVVTLLSRVGDVGKDPGLMQVIQSTEAIFDAALTVLAQKSSVQALGHLANRLIGDPEIRQRVLEAAKTNKLPTILGAARESYLYLVDLIGSSSFKSSNEEKAHAYGKFYEEVNRIATDLAGGKVRKTIGDAIIITWDGSVKKLEEHEDIIFRLVKLASASNRIAIDNGFDGARVVLHHGGYFFGLVGTAAFGQIDVIGQGIDYVCKLEGAVKGLKVKGSNQDVAFAVSSEAFAQLNQLIRAEAWQKAGFELVESDKELRESQAKLLKQVALILPADRLPSFSTEEIEEAS